MPLCLRGMKRPRISLFKMSSSFDCVGFRDYKVDLNVDTVPKGLTCAPLFVEDVYG